MIKKYFKYVKKDYFVPFFNYAIWELKMVV